MGADMSDYKELIDELRKEPMKSARALLRFEAANAIEQLFADVERMEAENRAKEQYIAETIGELACERERDDEIIASLQNELVEAAKERDAAISDLKDHARNCKTCLHGGRGKNDCLDRKELPCKWEWRGVLEIEDGNS